MKKIFITLSLAVIVLAGCKKEAVEVKNQGMISIEAITPEGEFTTPTKADDVLDAVDIKEFMVSIIDQDGNVAQEATPYGSFPAVVALTPNTYTVTAKSPSTLDAAWNQPIFEGQRNFVVEAGKVENVSLKCQLKNMKVTIRCTDRFYREVNDDFTITVNIEKTSPNRTLIYTNDIISAGTAGFFAVSPLEIFIKGTRQGSNAEISHRVYVSEVAARDHHVFTVDAQETGEVAIGQSGITIDYSVNNREEDVIVDGFEEEPVDPEDPEDNTGVPVLVRSSVTANAEVETTLGSISLTYSVPVKLAEDANITLGEGVTVSPTVINAKVVRISFGELTAGASYTLNVPEGAVLNATDDSPAAAYSLSFTTKAAPAEAPITITSPGIDTPLSLTNEQAQTAEVNVTIEAQNGISELWIDIDSEYLESMLVGGFNAPTTFDLANITPETQFISNLLNLSEKGEVKGAISYEFSIGSFMPLIDINEMNNTHYFIVTVIDSENNELTETITIVRTE